MLTHPNGNLVAKEALSGFNYTPGDIIITILKQHEDKYGIAQGLKDNIGQDITVVILDKPTKSQSETVYLTLKETGLKESFLIKDSDNTFTLPKIDEEFNYVCYSNIQDYEDINPGNKSYLKLNDQNIVTDVVEKSVVSKFFNVGGYYFTNPEDFASCFEDLYHDGMQTELYISHIIANMVLRKERIFFGKYVDRYIDWGTWEQWLKYIREFRTLFVDLDGVVFKSGAQFFKPSWKETTPITSNVETLESLSQDDRIQIFFLTARPESYRQITESQLEQTGIRYAGLIMGCLHAKRSIINDFSNTLPYPSCEAINVLRDTGDLKKYL